MSQCDAPEDAAVQREWNRDRRDRTRGDVQGKRDGVVAQERHERRGRGQAVDYDALDAQRLAEHGPPEE